MPRRLLTALTGLTVAVACSLATPGATGAPDPRSARLRTAVAVVSPSRVSVAVLSGGVLRTAGPELVVRAASLIKLLIVDAALDRGPVIGAELVDARKALQDSDNDAATRVWRAAGGDAGVARVVAELGLVHTHRAPVDLEPWDGWTTTAADQVRVVADAVARPGGLVARLLAGVEADQRWGVDAAAPAGSTAIAKDGWLPVTGGWLAHSAGCVTLRSVGRAGGVTCLAVLTAGSPSYEAGTLLATAVARAALTAVR